MKNKELLIDIVILAFVLAFIFSYFQPQYIFSLTTTTGGDTASHYYFAQYLRDYIIPSGRLSAWNMGNYAGFPVLQFYFPLAFVFQAVLGYIIPLQITFKLGTILGTLLLPICAYLSFRAMKFKFPIPAISAVCTLAFLFHEGNSMWGGNIPSTLAGEYSYSLGLALLVLFLGLIYSDIDNGKHTVRNSILLFLVGISHVYTLLIAVIVPVFLLISREKFMPRLKNLLKVYGIAFLLLGFFIIPMAATLKYTTSYTDKWFIDSIWTVFPKILVPFALAAIAAVILLFIMKSVRKDDRLTYMLFVIFISFVFYLTAIRLKVVDIRFIPFIQLFAVFIAVYLLSVAIRRMNAVWIVAIIMLIIVSLWVKSNVTYIDQWIPWNYDGFEKKGPWPNFVAINDFLKGTENDPRVVFEHNEAHNAFGTSRAFESLPLFSGRSTLEGLYMQSSLNAPFIFYIQSEVGEQQSCPFPNFGCSHMDFAEAKPRLEMFNVKEMIIYTDSAKAAIGANPDYQLLKTFDKYQVWQLNEPEYHYVYVPEYKPIPVQTKNFQLISFLWFINDSLLSHPLVNDFNLADEDRAYFNPTTIKDTSEISSVAPVAIDNSCHISEKLEQEKITFTTDCIGKPHIIKVTYFPNWKVIGAKGVYQASPSFMMVIPTQNEVTLYYGRTKFNNIGTLFTIAGIALLVLFSLKNKRVKKWLSLDWLDSIFRFLDKFKLALLILAVLIILYVTISSFLPVHGITEESRLRTEIAVATSKYSICEHAGAMRSQCFIEVGKKTYDYNLCAARIYDQKTKDLCYKEIAIAHNDSNLCRSWIKDEKVKAECVAAIQTG